MDRTTALAHTLADRVDAHPLLERMAPVGCDIVCLRYRPDGASLVWYYEIYRPDETINQHVRDTLAEARERTGLPTYEGTPEA